MKTLIDEALRYNRDLRMALLKVQEARAQYQVTDADRYPQLDAQSSGSWQGNIQGNSATDRQYDAGLNLSFDLDFFGTFKKYERS